MTGHKARDIKLIVVHHSASSPTWTWENVHKFHAKKFKMYMGYHRLMERDGFVMDGRRIQYRGAHAPPNKNRFGIVVMGWNNHPDHPEWGWTDKQWNHLIFSELPYWARRFPNASICGHNQTKATLCPGLTLRTELLDRGWDKPERLLEGRLF